MALKSKVTQEDLIYTTKDRISGVYCIKNLATNTEEQRKAISMRMIGNKNGLGNRGRYICRLEQK